jgi:hypothetical protein
VFRGSPRVSKPSASMCRCSWIVVTSNAEQHKPSHYRRCAKADGVAAVRHEPRHQAKTASDSEASEIKTAAGNGVAAAMYAPTVRTTDPTTARGLCAAKGTTNSAIRDFWTGYAKKRRRQSLSVHEHAW